MDGSDSPEQSIPKEAAPPTSWAEIRNRYQNSSYSETYQVAMGAFRRWEATPDNQTPEWIRDRQIDEQIAKARVLPNVPRAGAKTYNVEKTVNKISTVGGEIPAFGEKNTTRIYLGVDPRKAADAYTLLLDELEAKNVIKDIDTSLNMEELKERMLTGNTMIIYEPMSRPEVLDRVLDAYRAAKQKHPEPFALTPQQRAKVMRWNLRHFHGTVDINMSFVEQPAVRRGGSFDTQDALRILSAFGLDPAGRASLSDLEWLNHVKTRENRIVLDSATQYKFDHHEIKKGDPMGYDRKLSAPAIIQTGTIIAKQDL